MLIYSKYQLIIKLLERRLKSHKIYQVLVWTNILFVILGSVKN